MAYIGSTPTSQNFTSGTDYFSGTGSQTAFTLTRTVNSVNDIEVVINNVVQQPSTAYTLSGTTITFTSAPSSGTNNIYVRYLATNMQSFTVPANSIDYNKLDSNLQSKFAMKNRIINGAMVIDQRNAGASVTQVNTGAIYPVDRFAIFGSVTSKFTAQQNAGGVTAPAGFTNYLGTTSSSAYTVGASELFIVSHKIEGFNVADLNWGSVNAKTVTLSFWTRSSLTGTFGGSITNSAGNRSYPFTYTISASNTWEQKSITVAGDTTGTWLTTNGSGLELYFNMGTGATYSGTAGSWSGGNYYSATGATSVVGTSGATWYVTGVQLEVGSSATGYEYRQYGTELQLCQRYYEQVLLDVGTYPSYIWQAFSSTGIIGGGIYVVPKRASATITKIGTVYCAPANNASAGVITLGGYGGNTTCYGLALTSAPGVLVAGNATTIYGAPSGSNGFTFSSEL